jgi:hypothetical protein
MTAITISKLEAARRQLETAITLWFNDGDPVSTHTLACAAYEIIHVVSSARNRTRDLLFDTVVVKDEYRSAWNQRIKGPANFFKHARNDPDGTLDFDPKMTNGFILFSLAGLRFLVDQLSRTEGAYVWWLHFHRPELLTDSGRKELFERFGIEEIRDITALPKSLFFKAFLEAPPNAPSARWP